MTPSLVASRVRIRAPRTADAEQLGFLNRQLGYATETEELVARIDRLSELDGHFVAVAEAFGARGIRVGSAYELPSALAEALGETRPVLIDVPLALDIPWR